MPLFDDNPLEKLAFDPGAIDKTVDLGELPVARALEEVDTVLQNASPGLCIRLRFAPARGDGTETLFQPLGRFLLQARRDGRLERCLPASDGAAYVVVVAHRTPE